MFQHVLLEVALVGEGLLAEPADERLLSGVGAQVALVVVLAREPGQTVGALQTALCRHTGTAVRASASNRPLQQHRINAMQYYNTALQSVRNALRVSLA